MAKVSRIHLVLAVVLAFNTACTSGTADGEKLRSEVTRAGDTTVVTNYGEPARLRSDSIRVGWQSWRLERPKTLILLGDRLIVADDQRIHILSLEGEFLRTVGREGHGPREFEYVVSLVRFGTDTLAVHDAENQRISFFTPDGDFLGSVQYAPLLPYGNPVSGYHTRFSVRRGLVRLPGGVVSLWRERINWTRPTRTALVWHDLQADTAAVLESWNGETWFRAGGRYAATVQLFGPQVIAAFAPDGRLAVGNGIEYCITIHVVMQGGFRRICRDRTPAPVGAGIRNPDLRRLSTESFRRNLAGIVKEQEVSKYLHQFDRMLFDEEGRLWVRTLGEELSNLHPYLLEDVFLLDDAPELRPSFRAWDVFDELGRLLTTIEIPSNFDPHVIQSGRIYGFVELPTGEVAVGVVTVAL